jgi:multiple sugar transport system ATP-binding protein
MDGGAKIVLKGVNKTFGKNHVLKDVDLTIEPGSFCVFVGPSGCGKSTLLRVIAGLESIDRGDLLIDGGRMNDAEPSERGAAMVFQSYALYPHMTVYENMAFGLRLAKSGKDAIDQRVRDAARILQLEPLLERLPKQLSGGQRQRVAIGRAITRNPKTFLFDEPLSNLDAALRVQMRIEIAHLHERLKATMIYVTHDQVEAMTLADSIVILNAGRVEQVGAPLELYHRPKTLFAAGFIGSPKMNLLAGRLMEATADGAVVALAEGATVRAAVDARSANKDDEVVLGIRPEHVELGGDAGVASKVRMVEHLGDTSITYLDLTAIDGSPATIKREGDTKAARGDAVTCAIPARACHLFDARGAAFARLEGTA